MYWQATQLQSYKATQVAVVRPDCLKRNNLPTARPGGMREANNNRKNYTLAKRPNTADFMILLLGTIRIYSTLFDSIRFYRILFDSVLFYSTRAKRGGTYSILIDCIRFYSVLFDSILFYRMVRYGLGFLELLWGWWRADWYQKWLQSFLLWGLRGSSP